LRCKRYDEFVPLHSITPEIEAFFDLPPADEVLSDAAAVDPFVYSPDSEAAISVDR
jgi:hypothetical protein